MVLAIFLLDRLVFLSFHNGLNNISIVAIAFLSNLQLVLTALSVVDFVLLCCRNVLKLDSDDFETMINGSGLKLHPMLVPLTPQTDIMV